MTVNPDLTATYDTVAETLAVTGTFELKPGATKIVAVEVEDVWLLSDDELIALKTKASDLLKPLAKSNLLGQGTALKGSIDADIDSLLRSQNDGVKPENRIRTYREAQLSLATTEANLTQLENLVAQAGSNSSLLGFVGGVSTTAVFGIILVIVAGFVFMSVYFKKLALAPTSFAENVASTTPEISESELLSMAKDESPAQSLQRLSPLSYNLESKPAPSWQMPAIIATVVVVTAGGHSSSPRLPNPNLLPSSTKLLWPRLLQSLLPPHPHLPSTIYHLRPTGLQSLRLHRQRPQQARFLCRHHHGHRRYSGYLRLQNRR